MKRRKFLSSIAKTAFTAASARAFPFVNKATRPQLALTMDDPTLSLGSVLKWQEANARILKAIASKNVRSALFVCGMRVDEQDGSKLLSAWDQAGHLICNHSYSHRFYNNDKTSYADFAVDFLKNEKIIAPYHNRTALFRYPFLKEGDTVEKRDRFRALLKERGYRVGHVTIECVRLVREPALRGPRQQRSQSSGGSRDYLIAHLLNALVLPDVLNAFEAAGWQWIDASLAFDDPVFRSQPQTIPAGESLVWALAKETGKLEDRLRYPGEDDVYERPKLDALGL